MTVLTNNTTQLPSAEYNITWWSSYLIILSVQGSSIILVNLLTIITFTINRHLCKRSKYCVINLAVADMLFGIAALFSTFVDYFPQVVLIVTTGAGALFSLALVALERMCATVWPVRHRNSKTWAYTLAISMTWAAVAVGGLLSMVTASKAIYGHVLEGLGISVVVGVICVSYLVIFIKVKRQKQQMADQRASGPDQRLAMTLFIVTMASFGTWTPLLLVFLLRISDAVINFPCCVDGIVNLFAFSNSLINPIIYVFRMKDFRKALVRLLLKCSRDRPTQVVPLRQTNNRQNRQIPACFQ